MFRPTDAYVYEIPGSLPRAFVAVAVSVAADGPPSSDYYDDLVGRALNRNAVVSPRDAGVLGGVSARLPQGRVLVGNEGIRGLRH